MIRWTEQGLEYEADQRHADLLVREMKVEDSKSTATPMVSHGTEKEGEDEEFYSRYYTV